MNGNDTTLGGSRRQFPDTTEGLLSRLSGDRDYRSGIEELCRRYWKPVYRYLRIAWAKTNDDAKDITQSFFLWLAEAEALRRYDAGRGGFRRFLKLLLNGFVSNELKSEHRLKRGGGRVISLDDAQIAEAAGADETDPGRGFDRA